VLGALVECKTRTDSLMPQDNVPEWLTGQPAKLMPFGRQGSNPCVVVFIQLTGEDESACSDDAPEFESLRCCSFRFGTFEHRMVVVVVLTTRLKTIDNGKPAYSYKLYATSDAEVSL
jgi:hypothetical protein